MERRKIKIAEIRVMAPIYIKPLAWASLIWYTSGYRGGSD